MGKLAGLPFVQILAGLVQTVTSSDPNASGGMVQKKYPVSSDTNIPDICKVTPETSLIPNSGRASIIYFEDFGVKPAGTRGRANLFNSSLRLVCWYNKPRLSELTTVTSSSVMAAKIIKRLEGTNPENHGLFLRVKPRAVSFPIMDAAIFGRYSYKEEDRQYLRPPFDFFAIDFSVNFEIKSGCYPG